jgi:hypothetical protein
MLSSVRSCKDARAGGLSASSSGMVLGGSLARLGLAAGKAKKKRKRRKRKKKKGTTSVVPPPPPPPNPCAGAPDGAANCGSCHICQGGQCANAANGTPCPGGNCLSGTCKLPPAICAGKDSRVDTPPPPCHAIAPQCFCFVTAEAGVSYCGQGAKSAMSCAECAATGAARVALSPVMCIGGIGCSLPCPYPR